jgi:quercetin dioxygenase-like cupin family protein
VQNLPFDETHVWGRYRELHPAPNTIVRSIEYHVGGRTSVHRHPAITETLLATDGTIRVLIGTSPENLIEHQLTPGTAIDIPSGLWHAAECVEPAQNRRFATAIEVARGEMSDHFSYHIERSVPASTRTTYPGW